MERGRKVIGLLLIIISIFGLFFWEKYGKAYFFREPEVLILRENVEKGTIITEDMLATMEMDIDEDYIPPQKKTLVVGKQAAAFLHKGVPLFVEYFQDSNLAPNQKEGAFAMEIPLEWIHAKPKTLSRGDRVFFFYDEKMITSAFVSGADETGIEVILKAYQASALSSIISDGKKLVLIYQ